VKSPTSQQLSTLTQEQIKQQLSTLTQEQINKRLSPLTQEQIKQQLSTLTQEQINQQFVQSPVIQYDQINTNLIGKTTNIVRPGNLVESDEFKRGFNDSLIKIQTSVENSAEEELIDQDNDYLKGHNDGLINLQTIINNLRKI
jgi:ribosomal protein L29